jgi:hypothetical protein
MKRIIITLFALVLFGISCNQEPIVEPVKPDDSPEALISRDWKYEVLIIDNDTLNIPDGNFEPFDHSFIGDLYHIRWRWFRYLPDGTYDFRKDTGIQTTLGGQSESDDNFQPTFGYWEVDPAGITMTHNIREKYIVEYKIVQLNEHIMIREYERIVQQSSDPLKWVIGDNVVYREVFVPKID